MSNELDLADWRRRVADMYGRVRTAGDPAEAARRFRAERDELFRTHVASPIPQSRRGEFAGLPYYPYDPAWRVAGSLYTEVPREELVVDLGARDGLMRLRRFGRVRFDVAGTALTLDAFGVLGYGGGVFLPFADATSGTETDGAGRYLYDTAKGADLGRLDDGRLVLDFNFAYHPSCAYDGRWVCPLPPPQNKLPIGVLAGERLPVTGSG